jgi:uncharacterized damage-inducible protein DinB
MISPQELASAFERNLGIIKMQTAGLTHQQSLLQPPFRGNCLNWVLGHILETRDGILRTLGQEPILSDKERARYGYGSEPVRGDGADILRLEKMLELLERSQKGIEAGLQRITPEQLAKETRDHRGVVTIAQRLFFQYFHETYHVGQTELLRQLAGTNDKVI